jgi:hypothetical protein
VINRSSNNATIATLPSSVTIPAGLQDVAFVATTNSGNGGATITGFALGFENGTRPLSPLPSRARSPLSLRSRRPRSRFLAARLPLLDYLQIECDPDAVYQDHAFIDQLLTSDFRIDKLAEHASRTYVFDSFR